MKAEEWLEYLEPMEADLTETEALLQETYTKRRRGKRWPVVLAACILTAALGLAALAGGSANGWLASYFQVSDGRTRQLYGEMEGKVSGKATAQGFVVEVVEAASDGKRVCALVTVTAPEGVTFSGGNTYWLEGSMPLGILTDEKKGIVDVLSGGGSVAQIEWEKENQLAFLLDYSFHGKLQGKKLVLEFSKITEVTQEGENTLAQGAWQVWLEIPKSKNRKKWQWTKVESQGDCYYVYRVEVTPLGICVGAVMAKGADLETHSAIKDSFFGLPITVQTGDGQRKQTGGEACSSGGLFCEKIASYEEGRIMDPNQISEVWLGETKLKIR